MNFVKGQTPLRLPGFSGGPEASSSGSDDGTRTRTTTGADDTAEPPRWPGDERRVVAVVGAGAAATAFLTALAKQISADPGLDAPDIVVFEPELLCGPGFAYRPDVENALLNRPVSAMSVDYADRGQFRRWLHQHEPGATQQQRGGMVFASRPSFGRYLADTFEKACADLRNLGGLVQVVQERVTGLHPSEDGIVVETAGANLSHVDDVVACVGAIPARDPYRLSGQEGYFHQPYPLHRLSGMVADDANVLVLGAGLTAVDVALTMGRNSRNRLTLASRTGLLPDVRCELGRDQHSPDLLAEVAEQLDGKESLSLADVFGMLDRELVRSGTSLSESLRPFLGRWRGDALLRHRLAESGPAAEIQRCIVALTPWYSALWRSLDAESSDALMRKYHRLFVCLRSPMPPVNAQRLLSLAESGMLDFRNRLRDIRKTDRGCRAVFRDGEERHYDAVVNATGRGIDVSGARNGSLVDSLVRNGHSRPHPLGGLDVDPDSNEIRTPAGEAVKGLHVVGDLSSGVHFHTSSMEYVATQAQRVGSYIVRRLPTGSPTWG